MSDTTATGVNEIHVMTIVNDEKTKTMTIQRMMTKERRTGKPEDEGTAIGTANGTANVSLRASVRGTETAIESERSDR
jgi:hypothetical protein